MPARASNKPKEDANQAAFRVVRELTGDNVPAPKPRRKRRNPAALALGKLGASKGGKARAAMLSDAEKTAIARRAALVRWERQPPTPSDGSSAHATAVLVANDLAARGFAVYVARDTNASVPLIAVHPATQKYLRIAVRRTPGPAKYDPPSKRSWDHQATVLPGETIRYYPALARSP